jgi:hypothetical protein
MKAFPNGIITNDKGVIVGGQQGMDLRDWFAGLAMQDFMTSRDALEYEEIAELSYELAEQMMKARNI